VTGRQAPHEGAAAGLTSRLERCYTGALYDVLRELGVADCVLPPAIRPLDPAHRLAGPVFTVSGRYDETLDPRNTLLEWTGLLSKAPAGGVVVCQPNDSTLAHMGELSAETLKARGVRGYIVDGGSRDAGSILDIGFPVFCRYLTPRDIVGRWAAEALGEPVQIGGVTVHTGDWVLGDRDGVVVVPAAVAPEAVRRAEEVVPAENQVRRAIRAGMDPQEAYLTYGKF
jgi:regulator of RNase E activity RraA